MAQVRLLHERELPRFLEDLYKAYSFEAMEPGFAFAYDTTTEWRDISAALFDRARELVATLTDTRLAAQEKEFADKAAVCWRARGYGTLYTPDADTLSNTSGDQAPSLVPEFRARRKQYIDAIHAMRTGELLELYHQGQVVLDRGKGAPYWSSGTDRDICFAYGRIGQEATSYDDLERRVRQAGSAPLRFMQTSYIRIQGGRKLVPRYVVVGGAIMEDGVRMGPKVRRIGAQPFAVNHLWPGVANVLRTLMATLDDRCTGTVAPASAASSEYVYTAALDLAAFDTTVSLSTLDAIRDELLQPVLEALFTKGIITQRDLHLLIDCDYYTQRMPILMPPTTTAEVGYVAEAFGQTRSGENLTSWKGTEINRARIRAKGRSLGYTEGKQYVAYNYGDDTVLMTNDAEVIDRWAADQDFGGFNETIAPAPTFLMRHLPDGHNYFCRMLASCINRETRFEPQTSLAAGAAMRTRSDLLRGHPLHSEFLPLLASWERSERWETAVSLAASAPSAEYLNLIAAQQTLSLDRNLSVEPQLDSLRALGTDQALSVVEQITRALTERQRVASWADFQRTCSQITLHAAEREIATKSYSLEH